MSRKQFKTPASSGKAAGGFVGFGSSSTAQPSVLSYIQEQPDYSAITDANITVAFKNLSKKDSTTKAKALEDIQNVTRVTVDDAFLDAWVKVYPRLSIDSARRVRSLTHAVNGQVCASCGKRIAKHLSRIVGPWLAGTYDSDRATSKAALDALQLVFPSQEKVTGLRKTFQQSILAFCQEAITNETVSTLNDERSVSKDDAEATYARVISSCLALVNSMVNDLESGELEKNFPAYSAVLEGGGLGFALGSEPAVRRSAHRLVRSVVHKLPTVISSHMAELSSIYIDKGLVSDQTGSSLDFITTVDALTIDLPTVWTDAYTGKKAAPSRFCRFLKRGSQNAQIEFWPVLARLIDHMRPLLMSLSMEEITEVLFAAQTGITKREERFNASEAWQTYIILVNVVLSSRSQSERSDLLRTHVLPAVTHYLHPTEHTAAWAINSAKTAWIVSKVAHAEHFSAVLQDFIPQVADQLIDLIKTSLPEQSQEYASSQKQVAAAGERWAAFQREFFSKEYTHENDIVTAFLDADVKILRQVVQNSTRREGKPYGAAAVVDELLRHCGHIVSQNPDFMTILKEFVERHLTELLFTPSQRYLISSLMFVRDDKSFVALVDRTIETIVVTNSPEADKINCLRSLFSQNPPEEVIEEALKSDALQEFITTLCTSTSPGTKIRHPDLLQIFQTLHIVAPNTLNACLQSLISALEQESLVFDALKTLDMFSSSHSDVLIAYMGQMDSPGTKLLPSLLRLEETQNDDVATLAQALASKLSMSESAVKDPDRFRVVQQSLEDANSASLTVDALCDLTTRLIGPHKSLPGVADIVPDLDLWTASTKAALTPPHVSLAMLSPLGGAVNLINRPLKKHGELRYDSAGLSQPLRVSMFIARLAASTSFDKDFFEVRLLVSESNLTILALLAITAMAAEDNISVVGSNDLWIPTPEADAEAITFVSEASALIASIAAKVTLDQATLLMNTMDEFHELGGSPSAYYSCLAKIRLSNLLSDRLGYDAEARADIEDALRAKFRGDDLLDTVSSVISNRQLLTGSSLLNRVCNELVADITGFDIRIDETKAVQSLIKVNAILTSQEMVSKIAKQRLVFLVKHVLPWMEPTDQISVAQEVTRLLTLVLPEISSIYGEHWSNVLSNLLTIWFNFAAAQVLAENTPLLYWSLKLFAALRKLNEAEGANDDLSDVLKEKEHQLNDALLTLLQATNGISDETSQPLVVTFELLARQVILLPYKALKNTSDYFPLLYTPSRSIQEAAFHLLHSQIPAAQEKISFDSALENKTAHLPDELVSMLLEPPTLDTLAEASFDRFMPMSLQSYLYSWRLLFDHFEGASYKVKTDYTEQIKDGKYLSGLLDLTLDFLGHTRGKAVDVSAFDIAHYQPNLEPNPEKDVQWLLTHLYFLALTHLASLVKSYTLEIRSRQTPAVVEAWTAKYISPLIILASLQDVDDWSQKTVKEDPDYERMSVKVGMRSKEINVSYMIDEQTMAIKIVLPDAYPLAAAQVVGVNRVAVKEEKWLSWLRNCQGVIAFSNGSITDGLSAWRRNVTGALKGQTECAICYSIISADKQLPTKRCPTCKNLFHSSCLFKWFKTSNASTCPLCRNSFNFN